jgi:hypothetical protein
LPKQALFDGYRNLVCMRLPFAAHTAAKGNFDGMPMRGAALE